MSFLSKSVPSQTWESRERAKNGEDSLAMPVAKRALGNPTLQHWYAIKRILRYIKGTVKPHLCYQGKVLELRGSSDADWAGDLARESQ